MKQAKQQIATLPSHYVLYMIIHVQEISTRYRRKPWSFASQNKLELNIDVLLKGLWLYW